MAKKVIRTGLFTIKLESPKEIEAGGTMRFSIFFLHERDGPVNPSNLTCKVYEGTQRATLLATLTPMQDTCGTGSFFADYSVSGSSGSGALYVTWEGSYQSTGTSSALQVQATQIFRVINPTGKV
ncbi:MAG: hypothetical protein ACYC7D_05380 [Nitrososphaerales archaeon]